MLRYHSIAAVAAVFGALCSPCLVSAGVISSSTDEIFVTNAAHAGLAEVAAGKLAAAMGASASVRMVGQRMIVDHMKANAKLTSIAKADSLVVPAILNPADRAMIVKQK